MYKQAIKINQTFKLSLIGKKSCTLLKKRKKKWTLYSISVQLRPFTAESDLKILRYGKIMLQHTLINLEKVLQQNLHTILHNNKSYSVKIRLI